MPTRDVAGLAAVMAEVARHLDEPAPLDEVLRRILVAVRDTVPGAKFAGISVTRRGGKVETAAYTDPLVLELDELQYQLGQGPCLDAINGLGQCLVDDLAQDLRWPQYAPKAATLGVASQMGVELYSETNTIGGLNLYSDVAYAFDRETPYIARLFATHAAHAMGKTMKHDQLSAAVESRTVIGQAMGIILGRYQLDESRSFSFLKRLSQDSNTKLYDVAAALVRKTNEQAQESVPKDGKTSWAPDHR